MVRERNLEDDVQVASLVSLLVEWKTLSSHSFQIIGLNDLAGLVTDPDLDSIEVSDNEVNTC